VRAAVRVRVRVRGGAQGEGLRARAARAGAKGLRRLLRWRRGRGPLPFCA
jgi:hypothetical protein